MMGDQRLVGGDHVLARRQRLAHQRLGRSIRAANHLDDAVDIVTRG